MHHIASIKCQNRASHKFPSFLNKGQPVSKVARHKVYESTRTHHTRAIVRKKMDYLEQENRLLQEEMAAMQAKMDEMTEKMKTMEQAQTLPPPPPD